MEAFKKVLCVDYGNSRTGLAYSDGLWLTAVGAGVIYSKKADYTAKLVAEKAEEINAELILIGKPINMNGSEGFRVQAVYDFAELLKGFTTLPIEFEDERRTTIQAHNILSNSNVNSKKRKEVVDTLSAELILQTYMDRTKNLMLRSNNNESK